MLGAPLVEELQRARVERDRADPPGLRRVALQHRWSGVTPPPSPVDDDLRADRQRLAADVVPTQGGQLGPASAGGRGGSERDYSGLARRGGRAPRRLRRPAWPSDRPTDHLSQTPARRGSARSNPTSAAATGRRGAPAPGCGCWPARHRRLGATGSSGRCPRGTRRRPENPI